MAKNLPFVVRPRLSIIAVGNEETGIIHLLSKKGISPNENPSDLEEAAKKQVRMALIVDGGIRKLMAERGITRAEARKLLFGMQIKSATPDSQVEAVEAKEAAEAEESLYDYIPREQAEELVALRENKVEIAIKASTLFIQYRVAYPVCFAATLKPGAAEAQVYPLQFPLNPGDRLKTADGVAIDIAGIAEAGAETLKIKPIGTKIEENAIAYLMADKYYQKLGAPEWTIEDTCEFLTEELIEQIYRFYRQEAGGIPDLDDEVDGEGKSQTPSSSRSLPDASQSTGPTSTGGSNSMASKTSDSTGKILETVQTG